MCLVHFAKTCKDVNSAFEVLNKVYLQKVDSLDSSRDLQSIHAKSFVNRLHLVLQISKIPFHFNAFTVFLRLHVKI